ncbi:MAG: serine hydrolase domain-containing protein [Verrucomicrobiae bacterium]
MCSDPATRLRLAFERNFTLGREVGAAVSVWQDGCEIAGICGGFRDAAREIPWGPETLVLIWSATKGMAAACALHAIERAGLGLETRVAEVWPEFARGGKGGITIGRVLSHSAGLGALDRTDLSVMDHEGVVRAIEEQVPFADAAAGPGYGPRTFGFIVDEIVRRIAGGIPLGRYWRREFGDPLGLDLWIGLPEAEHSRAATILPPRAGEPAGSPSFVEAMGRADSLTRKAFASPGGLAAVSAMNSPSARSAPIPSMGGIGSARSLAKFYAMLAAGGRWEGVSYFGARAPGWMSARLSRGFDQILRMETSFSAGFMMDPSDAGKPCGLLGRSLRAFGHPGAGGSLGFADPDSGIGFGYVMNQMEAGVLPGERTRALLRALYAPEDGR